MELEKRDDGYWWVGFQTDHGFKWRNTKATTKPEAEDICTRAKVAEIEASAKSMNLTGEVLSAIMAGRKITCAQVLEEWVAWRSHLKSPATAQTQAYYLAAFLNLFDLGPKLVNRVESESIDAWVNAADAGSRSSREGRLAALRSFFGYAAAKGYIVGSPAKLVEVNHRILTHEQKEPKRREPITEAEYRQIIAKLTGFYRWATAMSYWAGLRLGDIASMEWDSIGTDEIVVWTRKRDARVALPLRDPLIGGGELGLILLEIMEECPRGKGRAAQLVFPEQAAAYQDRSKKSKLSTYFVRELERMGIDGKSFHCLRHSFCTRLDKAGKTEEEIGRLVGHQDTATTKGYIHK